MSKKTIVMVSIVLSVLLFFPTSGMAAPTSEKAFQIGDEGNQVIELQSRLIATNYLDSAATGYFGTDTQSAIIKFQIDNDLIADGKADAQTVQLLFDLHATSETNENHVKISTPIDQSIYPSSVAPLLPGDKGDIVQQVQHRLNTLEYYDYSEITGYYGPVTEKAVARFQRTNNLYANGRLDEETYELLMSEEAGHFVMCEGDEGLDIKSIQQRLLDLGYLQTTPTGYYGTSTVEAVRDFQNSKNLQISGETDQGTRSLLFDQKVSKKTEKQAASDSIPKSSEIDKQKIQSMIDIAKEQDGKPYVHGSNGPNSYDSSGFIYFVLKNAGIATSKLSAASYATLTNWITISDINSLVAGDVVFFKCSEESMINHAGIYLGGGTFIHASAKEGGVLISGMATGTYYNNFITAKRMF